MKKLTRLLLVNWHYFTHETISFETLNFLTGKNASGKSTIIDAMQLVLLGDTGGDYFNKAARGKGNRSLIGYLKGELGDDEDSGFKYLRNSRSISYIALEFFDEETGRYFTGGCCFDVYSENDIQKLFFLYDDKFPQNEFFENTNPWEIRTLRDFLKENYPGHKTTDIGREFRTVLYGKMGGLQNHFGALLKKAVSFNPNIDIQDFISEFVCDTQQTVDVSQMQENIRSYKRLEAEANILQIKIEQLGQIMAEHSAFSHAKQEEQLYSYLIDQAQQNMKTSELESTQKNAEELLSKVRDVQLSIANQSSRLSQMQDERNQLHARLINDEAAQAIALLESEIAAKETQINGILAEFEKSIARLSQYILTWNRSVSGMLEKLSSLEATSMTAFLDSQMQDICAESAVFLSQAECLASLDDQAVLDVGENGLQKLSSLVQTLSKHAIELSSRMNDEETSLARQRKALQQEQTTLESGIYQFPRDALDLKAAIASRLRTLAKQEVKVTIVQKWPRLNMSVGAMSLRAI